MQAENRKEPTGDVGPKYWSVPKLWPGETAVVIGTGPSLTKEDVDYCQGKARVIAVNDAYLYAPWADVLHGCDGKWWRWHPEAYEFKGIKTTMDKSQAGRAFLLRNTGITGYDPDTSSCRTGNNGGYQAVHLAVHFGAKTILLLGMDHTTKDGKTHFFGDHPDGIRSSYPGWFQLWDSLKEDLDRIGVQVWNCSRQTALRTFPRIRLEDILPERAE